MADRILTWHIPGPVASVAGLVEPGTKVNVGAEFVADCDYVPVRVLVLVQTMPVSGLLTVDVNDDGVSIFDFVPSLGAGHTQREADLFLDDPTIEEGSVITLDIDAVPVGATDLTVHLELREV
jgi:hypothetical protein